jgi:LytS/YehU family sensor histidine kinase
MYEMDYSDYSVAYFVSDFVTNATLIMMAVAFKLIGLMYVSESNIQELKKTNLKTELAYLKTQVNPHFLFNTLNNLFIMSKKADKKTPDAILQLSDLLRYQLYDCESEYVSIDKEVEYMRNYIELESLRRQDLDIKFEISEGLRNHTIRPLILLPFIENAFKYSNTGGIGSAFIHITIDIEGVDFVFTCKNNIGIIKASEVGGIGLANATRRLELAYPDSHQLDIQDDNQTFIVKLRIQGI